MDYNEKLKLAREALASGSYDRETIEYIFPELKERDDERIRKWLINLVKSHIEWLEDRIKEQLSNGQIYGGELNKAKDAIAWFEKQDSYHTFGIIKGHWYKCVCDYMLNNSDLMFKNGKLYYCRSDWRLRGEIDERNVKDIGVNGYRSFFRPATNQEIKDWLEKQDEQNPVDTVEHNIPHLTDFENAVKDMMNDYREAIGDNDATIEEIKELATYLLSLIHQRPTWSEEDEEIYQSIMDDTVQENQLNDKQTNWLRDIKCRYFPQPKQEWKQENTGDLNDFENAMMHIGDSFFGQHAGLDPNNTNAIKEQANLLLELVPNKEWSKEDENNILFLTSIIEECFKDKENITLCGDTICANFTKENVINRLKSLRHQKTWKPSDE